MGSSHSTPPPLVQVNAPRGKVLVPPGAAFTVHPHPSYACLRSDRYARGAAGPVYTLYTGGRVRARRAWNRPRNGHDGGTDIYIAEDISENGETMTAEMVMDDGMRRRRGAVKGNPVGMDTMGQTGAFERFDPHDTRPRSAPEIPGAGGYAGMPMGIPANDLGRFQQQQQQPYDMPPEYTSSSNLAGSGGDGIMAGAGMVDTFSSYPVPRPSPLSSHGRPSPQPMPRGRLKHYDQIPMAANADAKRTRKSPESNVDRQTSTHSKCKEASSKVTPRVHEWLRGDAFLDACTCTTGCRCRKGQRVLYRARQSRQSAGSGSEGEHHEYTSGEIRYVLKDDVGRDCGDDTGSRKSEGNNDENQSQRKKEQKEGKKLRRQLQSLKNELLDALDERFDDMRWERRQRDEAQGPAQPSLGVPGFGQEARQTGVTKYPHHVVVRPEFGPVPHGVSGLAAAGVRGHGSDVPDLDDGEYDSDNMEKRLAREPNPTSRYGAAAGRHLAMYSQTPGDRGMANKRHRSRDRRRRRGGGGGGGRSSQSDLESGEIDFELDERWMRANAGQQQHQQQQPPPRAGRERTRRGGGRLGHRDQDVASRRQRAEKHRECALQARADSDDESRY